jgi:hypothetical protein
MAATVPPSFLSTKDRMKGMRAPAHRMRAIHGHYMEKNVFLALLGGRPLNG